MVSEWMDVQMIKRVNEWEKIDWMSETVDDWYMIACWKKIHFTYNLLKQSS